MFDFLTPAPGEGNFSKTRYFKSMDMLVLLTKDVPYTTEVVDGALTLFWSPGRENLVGLKIKEFRHAFEKVKEKWSLTEDQFVLLVEILEEALAISSTDILEDLEEERKSKYSMARTLVIQDRLDVKDIEKQLAA